MKAGFKPKKFTKKEWQDNRSMVCKGSGVGKALDDWQKNCPNEISQLDKAGVAKAFNTTNVLMKALDVAEKKCNKKLQKDTIAGIGEYKKKVAEYQGLLKKALPALEKRSKLASSLDLQTVCADAQLLNAFVDYAKKKAFIYEALHSYLLWQKKKYADAVKLYGDGGNGEGDYNIDPRANKILYNTFIAKEREDQKDILAAIAKAEAGFTEMLTDARHFTALAEYPAYLSVQNARFPIQDFSL